MLLPDGVLRLSTPNLDWVMLTHYRGPRPPPTTPAKTASASTARSTAGDTSSSTTRRRSSPRSRRPVSRRGRCRYGESERPGLAGLERHETWEDTPDLPHVLVVEASGRSNPEPLGADVDDYRRDVGLR